MVHLHCMENSFSDKLSRDTTPATPWHFCPDKTKLYKDLYAPILRTETLGFRTRF